MKLDLNVSFSSEYFFAFILKFSDDSLFNGNWFSHEKHLHASPSEIEINQKSIAIILYITNILTLILGSIKRKNLKLIKSKKTIIFLFCLFPWI